MSITIHNVFDEERVDRDWYNPITFSEVRRTLHPNPT